MDEHADELNSLGHEPIETDVRAVWRTGAVIAGVVIASYVLIIGLMKWFTAIEGGPPANYAAMTNPNWEEQNPLQQLRVRERQLLNKYEWVDPATGVARIPVDRAIEIVSQSGLPAALKGPAASDSTSTQPSSSPGNTAATAENNEP
jgi:hypothetical protein